MDCFIGREIRWKGLWCTLWGRMTWDPQAGWWSAGGPSLPPLQTPALQRVSFLSSVCVWGCSTSQCLSHLCHGPDWAHALCKAVWCGNLNSVYWNIRRLLGPGIEMNEVLLYPWVVFVWCGICLSSSGRAACMASVNSVYVCKHIV